MLESEIRLDTMSIKRDLAVAHNRASVAKELKPGKEEHISAVVELTELIGSSPETVDTWLELQNER